MAISFSNDSRKALSIRLEVFGIDYKETASTIYWIGRSLYFLDRYSEAEQHFCEALSIYKEAAKQDNVQIANVIYYIELLAYDQE